MPQNCSLEGKKKKASLHKLPLPISQGLPHQMFILWHSSVSMCECYPVPTSIPYCNVKELEHKTAGMLQAKVKCSHITYLYEAGCYVMARLKRGPRRPETRHRSCPIQSCMYPGGCCSAVSLHFRGMRFQRLNTPIYVLKYSHSSLNYQK